MQHQAAHGSWASPVDAALAAAHDGRPDFLGAVGDEVWWTEPRPAEGGRRALVRRHADGTVRTLLPPPWNVRSRVLEYGGRPWAALDRPGTGPLAVFCHFPDQRLYAYEPDAGPDAAPRPLTPVSPVGGGLRWSDPLPVPALGEVWCVLEEYTGPGPGDVRRVLAAVPLDGSAAEDRAAVRELSDGRHRFVTGPRLSPDGRHAVWLGWDHPRMPWDGTEAVLADVTPDGRLENARTVAGGPEESVPQADWDAAGRLLLASDRSGWWNLYRAELAADGTLGPARALCPREEEFAGPLWQTGLTWFRALDSGPVAVLHGRGDAVLGLLDPGTGTLADAPGPWTAWSPTLAAHGTRVYGVAAGIHRGAEIVELDTATGRTRVVGSPHTDPVDPAHYPESTARVFTGPGGREVHAHVHPPRNPAFTGPDGALPPYVVHAHGGPTGHAALALDLEIAYFTSRGIGVVEVNYGGSTGYGRAYRERLRGEWGVVDVEDCAAVALALAAEGTADPARLAVRGGSAGGWTSAASLVRTDVYACGTIIYPVLDLKGWATGETHDFESRYLDGLVGPLDEVPERYAERSPIEHVDRITAPFLLLQGLDDVICPPAQAERFLARTAGRGVPHAYLAFPGEGHGFRGADTMVRALEAELALYARVFGFDRPDVPELELRT